MSAVPVGLRAVGLPWLSPSVDALVGLTADPPDGTALAADPVAVAHLLRFARPTPAPDSSLLGTAVLTQPGLCANAATLLERQDLLTHAGVPEPVQVVLDVAVHVAANLADDPTGPRPDTAACLTRLAGLGWAAVAAIDPHLTAELLAEGRSTPARERGRLGLDVAGVARRLGARWRLPAWATATLAALRLAPADAARLGAPPALFRIVQTALSAAEQVRGSFGLAAPLSAEDDLSRRAIRLASDFQPVSPAGQRLGGSRELIVQLLRATARARQAAGAVWLAEAEQRIDQLAETLLALRTEFAERVHDARMASMAEFAAGASHEINNPLAVISGHAQLLLAAEQDAERRRQLESIVRQTKRIHNLLQGTLQFARPPRPRVEVLRVAEFIPGVLDELTAEAEAKEAALRWEPPSGPDPLAAGDRNQIRQSLMHLVRNALDAVPRGGWVAVSIEHREDAVAICVEDNGPGPDRLDVAHLFDPFYSGRSAGRGRGLGLSIAWRLARINGAVVRYRPDFERATRFELVLREPPVHPAVARIPERRSA